jgi:hypothetical protein
MPCRSSASSPHCARKWSFVQKSLKETLDGQIVMLRDQKKLIGDLQHEVAGLNGQVKTLEGDRAALAAHIAMTEANVADIKGRLETACNLDSKIAELVKKYQPLFGKKG